MSLIEPGMYNWYVLFLGQIDSSVCTNVTHEAFQVVFSTFTTLLVDMTLPLNLKVTNEPTPPRHRKL